MNRRNYQKELDELLASFSEKKRLFLHCCCAPCSSYVLEYLHDFFDITVFFIIRIFRKRVSIKKEKRS